MTLLDAAEAVLAEAGKPLHYQDLASQMLSRGLWTTRGVTPANTVFARIWTDIRDRGDSSRFTKLGKGMFGLRNWNSATVKEPLEETSEPNGESLTDDSSPLATATLSFLDAAEKVLEQENEPTHYKDITRRIRRLNLVATGGRTPEATLYSQFMNDINRATRRGEVSRFVRQGKGYFGLTRWERHGLAFEIELSNRAVREELKDQLLEMSPYAFQDLIGRLLTAIGFVDVEVTGKGPDGGIDVRGTLVVGDVIRTTMAVQVKRWKSNIQKPIVQQVRGALGAHDQGLIITTSDFGSGARNEAKQPNKIPVALMNGDQLVALLTEYQIGVRRTQHELLELGDPEDEDV